MGAPRRIPQTRTATVLAVLDVTPLMRRIVFGGPGLAAAFVTPAGALGPYLKLVLPVGDARVVRTYSVRRIDEERGELHVDFVLHDHSGPGSCFAREAAPGLSVELGGPGFIPAPEARDYRIAGDHTALPAIAHILASLPGVAHGEAVIEVPDEAEIQTLPTRSGVLTRFLVRPHGTPSTLVDVISARAMPAPGETILWAGAEAAIARRIRREVAPIWGISPARCQCLNYWREGRSEDGLSYVD